MSVDVARDNIRRYGEYPLALSFANNDNVDSPGDLTQQAYSAAFDPEEGIRRHAACDECRMLT